MCGQAHPTELLSMAYGQMRLIMYLGFCTYGHGPHPTISASQRSGWQNDLHIRSGERTIVYDLALRNGRSIHTGELHLILSSGSLTTLVPVFQNTATINVICGLTRVFSIFFYYFFLLKTICVTWMNFCTVCASASMVKDVTEPDLIHSHGIWLYGFESNGGNFQC